MKNTLSDRRELSGRHDIILPGQWICDTDVVTLTEWLILLSGIVSSWLNMTSTANVWTLIERHDTEFTNTFARVRHRAKEGGQPRHPCNRAKQRKAFYTNERNKWVGKGEHSGLNREGRWQAVKNSNANQPRCCIRIKHWLLCSRPSSPTRVTYPPSRSSLCHLDSPFSTRL